LKVTSAILQEARIELTNQLFESVCVMMTEQSLESSIGQQTGQKLHLYMSKQVCLFPCLLQVHLFFDRGICQVLFDFITILCVLL
jgi:hypothetical protein